MWGSMSGEGEEREVTRSRRGRGHFSLFRRTDFVHMARYWLKRTNGGGMYRLYSHVRSVSSSCISLYLGDSGKLFDETFWIAGFDHFRASHPGAGGDEISL